MADTSLPYPHLMTHPTRAMALVYTPEAEALNEAQGYRLVLIDTRYVLLLFSRALRLTVVQG